MTLCSPEAHLSHPEVFETSEVSREACRQLKVKTLQSAIKDGKLIHTCCPIDSAVEQDKARLQFRTDLKAYALGKQPDPFSPKSFLLNAGNPVTTTTCSITEAKYGTVPGAIEYFKPAEDLQIAAFNCFNQLMDKGGHAQPGREPQSTLEDRWVGITGQDQLPAGLEAHTSVQLRQELRDVVGTTRMYSGSLQATQLLTACQEADQQEGALWCLHTSHMAGYESHQHSYA